MQGDATVIQHLNAVLRNEMTAVNQYFLHARMLDHWGAVKLGAHEYDESIDEMKHADLLIKRLLFLGGEPRLEFDRLLIGKSVRGPGMRSAARTAGDAAIARGDPLLRRRP
jgi:bacterioferritin